MNRWPWTVWEVDVIFLWYSCTLTYLPFPSNLHEMNTELARLHTMITPILTTLGALLIPAWRSWNWKTRTALFCCSLPFSRLATAQPASWRWIIGARTPLPGRKVKRLRWSFRCCANSVRMALAQGYPRLRFNLQAIARTSKHFYSLLLDRNMHRRLT